MMSQLVPFHFESHEVRTLTHDDGSIWWVLADVCAAIGLSNPSKAASRLKEDELQRPNLELGQFNIVNEKGSW
jgi:anti-repressor protein